MLTDTFRIVPTSVDEDTSLLHYCGDSNEDKNRLESYFSKLKDQGLADSCFYEEDVTTPEEFSILRTYARMFLIVRNSIDIGHCHLNNFEGLSARSHFSLSREVHGKSTQIGKEVLQHLFTLDRKDGMPFVTSLVGLTPVTNKLALKFIKSIGFKSKFTLRDSCYIAKTDSYVDGLVSLLEE